MDTVLFHCELYDILKNKEKVIFIMSNFIGLSFQYQARKWCCQQTCVWPCYVYLSLLCHTSTLLSFCLYVPQR